MMNQTSSISSIMQLDRNNKSYIYSDEQLIARFQGGDENAYVELVNRYRDRLINFVYNYIGDSELSEDIVQDTMVKLYQKKHYYKEINKFSTWLYTKSTGVGRTNIDTETFNLSLSSSISSIIPLNEANGPSITCTVSPILYSIADFGWATPSFI